MTTSLRAHTALMTVIALIVITSHKSLKLPYTVSLMMATALKRSDKQEESQMKPTQTPSVYYIQTCTFRFGWTVFLAGGDEPVSYKEVTPLRGGEGGGGVTRRTK